MLNIRNVSKAFGKKVILDNVSFSINRGEIAVLLGGSGVGKSTLLRVLNNLETLDSGKIYLDDALLDLATVNQTHQIGMVFQGFNLFEHLTVQENITLALQTVQKKSSQKAYDIAQLLLQRYGLQDKSEQYVSELSGGQKQRLAIARTLALKPQVLCLDEPTSALDPLLTTHVAQTITELADQDYTILIATHDTQLIEKLACTIYLMESGSFIESAQSSDFFANRSEYPRIDAFVKGIVE